MHFLSNKIKNKDRGNHAFFKDDSLTIFEDFKIQSVVWLFFLIENARLPPIFFSDMYTVSLTQYQR